MFPVSMFIIADRTWASTLSGSLVTQSCKAFNALGISLDNHLAFASIIWASEMTGYCQRTFSNNFTALLKYLG